MGDNIPDMDTAITGIPATPRGRTSLCARGAHDHDTPHRRAGPGQGHPPDEGTSPTRDERDARWATDRLVETWRGRWRGPLKTSAALG